MYMLSRSEYRRQDIWPVREVRRRNLEVFPFFVLYGLTEDCLIFGSVIPSALDPLIWLSRFK